MSKAAPSNVELVEMLDRLAGDPALVDIALTNLQDGTLEELATEILRLRALREASLREQEERVKRGQAEPTVAAHRL